VLGQFKKPCDTLCAVALVVKLALSNCSLPQPPSPTNKASALSHRASHFDVPSWNSVCPIPFLPVITVLV